MPDSHMTEVHQHLAAALAGRYAIERELGRGGMATVYLAQDLKHGRSVALKVMHPELGLGAGPERFLREVRTTARLDHPHVLAVHDSGEAEGLLWYTMPYVQGESLRQRLERAGPLPVAEAVRLAGEAADALDCAHQAGVVHRDIKPENILLSGGHARVADFGIAQALEAVGDGRLTATGVSVGTPAYMSPEQAAGARTLDGRSDVYSLGCVLYEVLTGEPPFTGPTPQAVIGRRFVEPPPMVRRARPAVPPAVEAALARALAREPADRFQTAAEFRDALVQAGAVGVPVALDSSSGHPLAPAPRGPPGRGRHWRLPSGIALVAVTVLAIAWFARRHLTAAGPGAGSAADSRAASIAVLPFKSLGLDSSEQYLSEGITEDLSNTLSRVPDLRVVARTSVFALKGKAEDVREVGRLLNVGALVEGSLRKSGDTLRVTAQLINVADGYQLWADRYERVSAELLDIEDELSRAIVRAIGQRVPGAARGLPSVGRPTDNPEAYRLYLKGRYHGGKQTETDFRAALRYYDQAIGLDPTFALAYASLSVTYAALYGTFLPAAEGMPKAKAAALRALEIDPDLPEAYGALAGVQTMYEWDWQGAERSLRRALELRPNDAGFRGGYGWLLVVLGRLREAEPYLNRARMLDPLSMHGEVTSVWPLYYGHRFDEAIALLRKTVAADSTFLGAQFRLGEAYMHKGEFGPAEARLKAARALIGPHPDLLGRLGYLYAKSGRPEKAQAIADTLRASYRKGRSDEPYDLAVVLAGLGETRTALDWLDTAYAERSTWMVFAKVSPELDGLRSEPRFKELLRRLHLD